MGRCCGMGCNRKCASEAPAVAVTEVSLRINKLSCPYFANCSPVECIFPFALADIFHLKIKSTDGQIALLFFFLHHLVLPQVYFGSISSAKGTGSSVCELLPVFLFGVCVTVSPCWLLCVSTRGCVHAVYHDGECSAAGVMLRGTATLVAVVIVEPDDMPAGQ